MSTSERSTGRSGGSGEPQRTPRSSQSGRRRKHSAGASAAAAVGKVIGTLLLVGIVTGCFLACYAVIYIQTVILPNADLDLDAFVLKESSTIYYTDQSTGQVVELATCAGDQNRVILDYSEIPQTFIDAAIAIEDKRFMEHNGVDWIRTVKGVLNMFTGQDIQGGSTITQQVIKNYTGSDEVTVKRKITEIFRALEVEKRYSKEEIITLYLNYIYLGGGQYGIATASRYYFDKDVSEISVAEAASIIAITNNPSLYGPYSSVNITNSETGETKTAQEMNKDRQELILKAMYEQGKITEPEYQSAVAQELVFAKGEEETLVTDINSWYVDEVISEVVDYFKGLGFTQEAANQIVYNGGLNIYTPYDPKVQAAVDEVYTNADNLPYTSKNGQHMQSAITVVDNSSGYVVAMAGAIGEKTGNRLWNFATDSTRQPGSSIKPLAVYSPAIEMGLITPATIIDDSPYQILNGTAWPRNDNKRYKGLTTTLSGITNSVNTIAVKILADYVSPEASYKFMTERYGITSLVERAEVNGQIMSDINVAPLSLGGLTNGLYPYEMTAAYATFPRNGAYTAPTVVLKVETKDGDLVWDNTPETSYVIKESTAYYMNTMLTNAVNNGTGGGARLSNMTVAGKTGTTSENYDRWFAGYTPYYTAVVWTGYKTPAYMKTDGNPAAKLWKQVMTLVHSDLENKSFAKPSNLSSYSICLDCGQLATDNCANDIRGNRTQTFTFVEGTQPKSYCTCHVPITICTASPILNEAGEATGAYHFATDFCPEDTVKTVFVVDYQRTEAAAGVTVEDQQYLMSYYESLQNADCTVHTTHTPEEETPEPTEPTLPPDWITPDTPDHGESGDSSESPSVSPSGKPDEVPPEDDYLPVN